MVFEVQFSIHGITFVNILSVVVRFPRALVMVVIR